MLGRSFFGPCGLETAARGGQDIAIQLAVSVNTVETHRKHTMGKLEFHSTAEIVRFALRKGVVS